MASNSVRSLVKPALHVGKQIAGGAGCRAWGGSGGIAGACTTGGGNGGETVAQPLASISSGNSISAGAIEGVRGFIGDLLQRGAAALFLGARGGLGVAAGLGQHAQLLGVPGAGVGVRRLLGTQAQGLHGNGRQQAAHDSGGDDDARVHASPAVGGALPSARCMLPGRSRPGGHR